MPERAWGFNSPLAHHRRLTAIAPALQGGKQVTYGSNEKVTLRGGLFGCFRAPAGLFGIGHDYGRFEALAGL